MKFTVFMEMETSEGKKIIEIGEFETRDEAQEELNYYQRVIYPGYDIPIWIDEQ